MAQDTLTKTQTSKRRRYALLRYLLLLFVVGTTSYYVLTHTTQTSTNPDVMAEQHWRRGFGQHDESPVVVAVVTAQRGDFPVYLHGLGTVTAMKTVTIRARVDGELLLVAFKEGQFVNVGDLLAEIDPRPFQAQLQQAQGQLLHDEALLQNALTDLKRYQTLQTQDSISTQQTVSQAALVKQYQGSVAMDKAMVNTAKLQLSYSRLTAPIAGRVGLRLIDQGNMIHAANTGGLAVITQTEPITVIFTLAEDKVPALIRRWRSNSAIAVQAFDRSAKIKLAEGKLTAIDNQIDPATGTLKLRAQFDNHEQNLFANQYVNIKLLLNTIRGGILISSAAIQQDGLGPYVYVIGSNHVAELRRIRPEPGLSENDMVAVLNNLAADELVVVEGADRLRDGSKVDIAQKDGQAQAVISETSEKPNRQGRVDKHVRKPE